MKEGNARVRGCTHDVGRCWHHQRGGGGGGVGSMLGTAGGGAHELKVDLPKRRAQLQAYTAVTHLGRVGATAATSDGVEQQALEQPLLLVRQSRTLGVLRKAGLRGRSLLRCRRRGRRGPIRFGRREGT
jgi:hypothetical protein